MQKLETEGDDVRRTSAGVACLVVGLVVPGTVPGVGSSSKLDEVLPASGCCLRIIIKQQGEQPGEGEKDPGHGQTDGCGNQGHRGTHTEQG